MMHVVTALDTTVEQLGQHQCLSRIALDNLQFLQLALLAATPQSAALEWPVVTPEPPPPPAAAVLYLVSQ